MYWLPPEPPLPVTEMLLRGALPPNWLMPARDDGTLNAMSAIGTFPIDVLAVTSAVPFSVKTDWEVSVTCWNKVCMAPSLTDTRGTLWNVMGRSASFPVETPPTVFDWGSVN